MEFDLNIWLSYREKSTEISTELRQYQDAGGRVGSMEWQDFCDELAAVTKSCGAYLDSVGIKLPAAKWKYNPDDQTTWVSHRDFAYQQLLRKVG